MKMKDDTSFGQVWFGYNPFLNRNIFLYWEEYMERLQLNKQRLSYVYKMLKIIWINDRKFIFYIFLNIISNASIPFIIMFTIQKSINLLTQSADYFYYLQIILLLQFLFFITTSIQNYANTQSGISGNMIGQILFNNIFSKSMELDYQDLLNKQILEKRELALKVIEGGKFNDLVNNFFIATSNIIVIIGIVVVVSSIEFWILLLVLVIIGINSYATSLRKDYEREVYEKTNPIDRKLLYFFKINEEHSYGKEIRMYNMQRSLNKRLQGLLKSSRKYVNQTFRLQGLSRSLQIATDGVLNVVIYLHLGYKLLVQNAITLGDFSMFLNAITSFNRAVQEFVGAYIDITNNGRYLQDYFDFINIETNNNDEGLTLEKFEIDNLKIEFENVSFTYPYQNQPVLENINLTLHIGERIALVGENGAGKTTFIKLLMRLYDPSVGQILLNGINIKDINRNEYYKLFSTVFQDFNLFAFKLRDNITCLEDEPNSHKIETCIDQAGLKHKISTLEKGLDTYIYKLYEEDGVEVSGGEGQKLALARALYRNANIIILDEPTAALDPRAEHDLYRKFINMSSGKLSIFISHRLSSTSLCDKVIVLKQGKVHTVGTHDKLVEADLYYSELYDLQAQYYKSNE